MRVLAVGEAIIDHQSSINRFNALINTGVPSAKMLKLYMDIYGPAWA
jgi:hypothetical protein